MSNHIMYLELPEPQPSDCRDIGFRHARGEVSIVDGIIFSDLLQHEPFGDELTADEARGWACALLAAAEALEAQSNAVAVLL